MALPFFIALLPSVIINSLIISALTISRCNPRRE
jgi:hypothetical protein